MQFILDILYNLPPIANVIIGCILGFLLTAIVEMFRLKVKTKNLMIVISSDICRTIQRLNRDNIETILDSEKLVIKALFSEFYNENGIYNQIKAKSEFLPRDKVITIHNFYLTMIEAESLRKSILSESNQQLTTHANNSSSSGQKSMIQRLTDDIPLQSYMQVSNYKISAEYSLLREKIAELVELIPEMEKEYCNKTR